MKASEEKKRELRKRVVKMESLPAFLRTSPHRLVTCTNGVAEFNLIYPFHQYQVSLIAPRRRY